jgi:hypothetical protein
VKTVYAELSALEPQVEDSRSARRAAEERVRPLRVLQVELGTRWRIALDLTSARARIGAGLTGYQPIEVIGSAGDLVVPFLHATRAIETAGLASNAAIAAARERRFEVLPAITGWLAGERRPRDPTLQVVRLAASIVAGSILRRASEDVARELSLDGWARATCPCCGSPPELAAETSHGRRLLCSRCDATWPCSHVGCLGCGARGSPLLARIPAPAIGYELTICNACGRYLKVRAHGDEIEPLVERALTSELEEAAERRGLRL